MILNKDSHKGIIMNHKLIITFLLSLLATTYTFAKSSIPPKHPKNNHYYICYKNISYEKTTSYSNYILHHYHGCLVTKMPCKYKSGLTNKEFGKFRTYPLALNAFYRCAYS